MNATIYWTGKRIQHTIQQARVSAKLWWLNEQVDFLVWRERMRALLSSSMLEAGLQAIRQEE